MANKDSYLIYDTCTLPSLGKVYGREIASEVTLRSMTTDDEMKRLNSSSRQYSVLAGIIDDCIVDDIGISSYDMCIADFQYVLHRLRAVTYGEEYKLSSTCPFCGSTHEDIILLNEIPVTQYDASFKSYFSIELPRSKKNITLKMQTPRSVDNVAERSKEIKRRSPDVVGDPAFLLNVASFIDTVDGKKLDVTRDFEFVRSLPLMDVTYILSKAEKLNDLIGLDTTLQCTCNSCGLEYKSSFRVTSEFFRPSFS